MATRRGPTRRKTAVRKPARRKTSPRKTARKKTTRSQTPRGRATFQAAPRRPGRRKLVGAFPAIVLKWSPAKTFVTFPYRAFRWASLVAADYRSFAVSLDRSLSKKSPRDAPAGSGH